MRFYPYFEAGYPFKLLLKLRNRRGYSWKKQERTASLRFLETTERMPSRKLDLEHDIVKKKAITEKT